MMRERLNKAINDKKNDINSFVWRMAPNKDGIQEEIRLMDATAEQLMQFYNHCDSMLNNTDKQSPGRYILLEMIKEQREKCNVELYLRNLESGVYTGGKSYPRHLYYQDLSDIIDKNKEQLPREELDNKSIALLTTGLPREFERLSIQSVLDGCLDNLGAFDAKHITFTFITNLGIYLTSEEMKQFNEKGKDRKDVIKERLGLKPNIKLTIKPSGLSFSEFRSMINLKSKKYTELTTDQLTILRNKILFKLEQEVRLHIKAWEERKRQIVAVAEERDIVLW